MQAADARDPDRPAQIHGWGFLASSSILTKSLAAISIVVPLRSTRARINARRIGDTQRPVSVRRAQPEAIRSPATRTLLRFEPLARLFSALAAAISPVLERLPFNLE